MAREWALRGMSEEELKPRGKPDPPQTPKNKWENYWYHYKWHTIATLAVAAVLLLMIRSCVMRPSPDYRIVLATRAMVSEEAVEKLRETFEACGKDLDSDGKVEVQVEPLRLVGDTQEVRVAQARLAAHLQAGDAMLFIFEKSVYDTAILPKEDEDYRFFAPPEADAVGMDGGGRFWNWKDDALRADEAMAGMPEELYFGVRSVSGTSSGERSRQIQEQVMELFRAFLESRTEAPARPE